jgi:hypothetical protein
MQNQDDGAGHVAMFDRLPYGSVDTSETFRIN